MVHEHVPSGCCEHTGPPRDPSEHITFGELGAGPLHAQVLAESLVEAASSAVTAPSELASFPDAPDPIVTIPPQPGPSAPVKKGTATRTGTVHAIRWRQREAFMANLQGQRASARAATHVQ
jgi:hypothetical protein